MRRSADSLLPPNVQSAIRDLYAAFSHVERPVEIDVCPCCISLEELEAIQTKPLGELTTDDLYNYSYNALLNVGNEEDFRYFLPRILEILAKYPECWGGMMGFAPPWIVLSKLRMADWETWSAEEQKAITVFLDSVYLALLSNEKDDIGLDIDDWLSGIAECTGDLSPYLHRLLEVRYHSKLRDFYRVNSEYLSVGKLYGIGSNVNKNLEIEVVQWFQSEKVQEVINDNL